jgi:AbrB family looped-hinge helix DNA binding protein
MDVDITTLSSKGQVVIPRHLRKQIGWREGQTLAVSMQDGLIVLKKINDELDADELRTLNEVKTAWREIAQGKCKRMSSDEFVTKLATW